MRKPILLICLLAILSIIACEEEDNLNKLPSKPVLLSPENGTIIDINSITFRWGKSTDPEDDDVAYTMLISNDSINWETNFYTRSTELTVDDSTVFQEGEKYFWKVKAENVFYWDTPVQEQGESISNINHFYTIPPGVENLKETSGHEFVTLYWNDPSDLEYVEITFEPNVSSINQPIKVSPGTEKLELTGLNNGTLYTFYLNTYNNQGHQSNTDTIKALPLDPTQVHDADFNIYNITKIGNQTWLRENLRTTKYQDGSPIESSNGNKRYIIGSQSDIYGYYYRIGFAFGEYSEDRDPCPCGYHVPTNEELLELERFLGMPEDELNNRCDHSYRGEALDIGNILKSTTGWANYNGENGNGTDLYMFNLLPAGFIYEGEEKFMGERVFLITNTGSSTIYVYRGFSNQSGGIMYCQTSMYQPIRCIKD